MHGPSQKTALYRIGEMSALTGVTPDTLRYYEREGLLSKPSRTAGGFRLYGDGEVDRLAFIKRAQAIGLSLDEIRNLLSVAGPAARCQQVRDLVQGRIAQVDQLLADLRTLRRSLAEAERACNRAISMDLPGDCPVISGGTPGPRPAARRPFQRKSR